MVKLSANVMEDVHLVSHRGAECEKLCIPSQAMEGEDADFDGMSKCCVIQGLPHHGH